jgi:hypothetical protein
MAKEKLIVTEEYLDKVTSQWAKSLVGKMMKRFEILDDKDAIKRDIKELIYENIRDLKVNIKAFNWGVKFNRTSSDKR